MGWVGEGHSHFLYKLGQKKEIIHERAAQNLGNSLGNCSYAYKIQIGFRVLISSRNPIVK